MSCCVLFSEEIKEKSCDKNHYYQCKKCGKKSATYAVNGGKSVDWKWLNYD